MIDSPEPFDEPELRLPAELVADLRATQTTPRIDSREDQAILRAGRRILLRRRRSRWLLAGLTSGAIAAGIAMVVMLNPASTTQQSLSTDARDLNHDGRVDILDAFVLARRLEKHDSLPAWDFNHDGKVDRADVDAIASEAVKVSHLTRSAALGPAFMPDHEAGDDSLIPVNRDSRRWLLASPRWLKPPAEKPAGSGLTACLSDFPPGMNAGPSLHDRNWLAGWPTRSVGYPKIERDGVSLQREPADGMAQASRLCRTGLAAMRRGGRASCSPSEASETPAPPAPMLQEGGGAS